MKTILRLAVLALAGTSALALAGNALATQKLSVKQTTTSLTIKVSQAQTDPQPAKISIYAPTGYTINASAAPGTKIGSTSGTVFSRDANIPLPLSGDVVVAATSSAPTCDPVPHLAVWNLNLSVAGQAITLPVHVDQTAGAEAALGSYKLVVCLAPDDVPVGTPGRSPNGARLLDATFTVDNVFTVPAGQSIWKAITTPWAGGAPNAAGTVETRAFVANGTVTLAKKVNAAKRLVKFTGRVTQAHRGIGLEGHPPRQRQVRGFLGADERFRRLQHRAEEDGQEDDLDVPGTHDRGGARHHVNRMRLADARRPGRLHQRNGDSVHLCERQDQNPPLRRETA